MSAEHDELMNELTQNRAFEVLERQERIDNARSLTECNWAVVKLNDAAAELNKAKARFWRAGSVLLVSTWWLACAGVAVWLVHLLH